MRLFIKTWGCQMNAYDSVRMAEVLAPMGYSTTSRLEEADLVILNTCHIRAKASEKVFSALGRLRSWRKRRTEQGHQALIALAGCVAQAEGREILTRAPWVDLIFGPQSYHRLPELISRCGSGKGPVIELDFLGESKFDYLPEEGASQGVSAFLSVQEGCDKFCTFCVVPYTRGAEFSRPVRQVLDEARCWLDRGARELILLGQNVTAYHGRSPNGGSWGLGRLIRAVAELSGVRRIRYTTSHPTDIGQELIDVHAEVPQLMPSLHLPLQSGSDRILAAMNRRHASDDYLRIVDKLRRARPDMALSSDFIVGFPGERDEDFADTLRMINRVGYAQSYSFRYSPRPGTPAAISREQVDDACKRERLVALQQLLQAYQEKFNRQALGHLMPVLFQRPGRHRGQLQGRSPYMQSVYVDAPPEQLGQEAMVRITHCGQHSLSGVLSHHDGLLPPTPSEPQISFQSEQPI